MGLLVIISQGACPVWIINVLWLGANIISERVGRADLLKEALDEVEVCRSLRLSFQSFGVKWGEGGGRLNLFHFTSLPMWVQQEGNYNLPGRSLKLETLIKCNICNILSLLLRKQLPNICQCWQKQKRFDNLYTLRGGNEWGWGSKLLLTRWSLTWRTARLWRCTASQGYEALSMENMRGE